MQDKEEESEAEEDEISLEDIRKILLKILGRPDFSVQGIGEWLACDSSDLGFQIQSHDEIVESMMEKN